LQILIVGGGIAGLALAKALEQRGIAADLVERQAGEPANGAGLYLLGNATRALQQLGLLAQVMAASVAIETQHIFDWRGKLLNTIRTQDVWHECGPCLALPRNALQAMLQAALVRTDVSLGKAVADIRQSPAGCEVAFDDGTAGTYDLVVGADGVNSAVRRITFPAAAPRYLGTICWRAIIRNTVGIDGWTSMLGNGRTLLALPVSPTDVYIYADITVPADGIGEFSPRSALPPLLAGFGAPVFPLIENLPAGTKVHFGRIEQVRMAEWVKGRVVVIGDAAHASSPSMASGAAMAMEDALVLAEAITAGPSLDKALATYEARRRPRVEWVQAQCALRDRMRRLPALARSVILKPLGQTLYRRNYAPLLKPI
jgi:2-polyprenyl-6-methoxyphenol hydroxylase-like FAD-dependent oxidoreductase